MVAGCIYPVAPWAMQHPPTIRLILGVLKILLPYQSVICKNASDIDSYCTYLGSLGNEQPPPYL
jgi:hypothetical protein